MPYPEWVREQALELYRQGDSTHAVARELEPSRSTIRDWVTSAGISRTHREVALSRLRPGWNETTPELAEIVGMLWGDGWTTARGTLGLAIKAEDRAFPERQKSLWRKQFGLSASMGETGGMIQIQMNSRPIAEFLRSINVEWVKFLERDSLLAWIRGVWDSEGSISKNKEENTWRVQWVSCDHEFALLYAWVLENSLAVKAKCLGPYKQGDYRVTFSHLQDVVRFYQEVNPTIPRKRSKFKAAQTHFQAR